MKRPVLLLFMFMAAFLSSCQKEPAAAGSGNDGVGDNSLYVSMEQYGLTKTYVDEQRNVRWQKGDQIAAYIQNMDLKTYKVADYSDGKTSGYFFPVKIQSDGESSSQGDPIPGNIAYYPYDQTKPLTLEYDGEYKYYRLSGQLIPNIQNYDPDHFVAQNALPMASWTKGENNSIAFHNLGGILEIQLKGNIEVKSLLLQGLGKEPISGQGFVDMGENKAGELEMKSTLYSGTSSKTIALHCGDGVRLNLDKATVFRFVVAPVVFEKGFKIQIDSDDNSSDYEYTIEHNTRCEIQRSSITQIPLEINDENMPVITVSSHYIEIDKDATRVTAKCKIESKNPIDPSQINLINVDGVPWIDTEKSVEYNDADSTISFPVHPIEYNPNDFFARQATVEITYPKAASKRLKIIQYNDLYPNYYIEKVTNNGMTVEFVMIQPTYDNIPYEFTMGYSGANPEKHPWVNELPAHDVEFTPFLISQTEVTQELWECVMGYNPSSRKGPELPVTDVSWNEICGPDGFLHRLNRLTGYEDWEEPFIKPGYDLPTEAQWEFAARGGTYSRSKRKSGQSDYKFSGSDVLPAVAWYVENSYEQTHRVATKAPNELGLYDMSGNVFEWCKDWYGPYEVNKQGEKILNPTGPETGTERVMRGGWSSSPAMDCRVLFRMSYVPDFRSGMCGFRIIHHKNDI